MSLRDNCLDVSKIQFNSSLNEIDLTFLCQNFVVKGQFQKENPDASLKRSHGILNMLGWGILMPIGVLVARHMRQWDPIWFYSHSIIQSCGFVLGVAGVICGIVLEDRLGANVNKHKGLGIFILTLGCLQVCLFHFHFYLSTWVLTRKNNGSRVEDWALG